MKLTTILGRITEQKKTTPKIGALMNAYSSTAVLYSPLTLIGVVTTLYGLWGRTYLAQYFPWMTIWHLLGIMIGIILVAMIFFYKFIIPSQVAFASQQTYKHRNPLVKDMKIVLLQQKIINIRLANLEGKSGIKVDGIEEIEKKITELENEREIWEQV
jgi:hypothetical protein